MTEPTTYTQYSISADVLRDWAQAAFQRQSLNTKHATLVARSLVQTSLWGIDTHGIARLPHYLRRIEAGSIEAQPTLAAERTGPATASVDGGHGLGMVICNFAMDQAIQLAGEGGAGVVGVHHSSHCGAIGLYGRQAAAAGMISIAMTHSDAMVAPYRGKEAFFGTNPLCITVPCANSEPICVDIATSIIPFNQVMNARRDGLTLPTDAAVDIDGNTTICADDVTALLPFADHKGFALAFLIDILCGPVNGMNFGPHLAPMYGDPDTPRNLGSMMIAIDPARFAGGNQFTTQVARLAAEVRAQPAADSEQPVLAPGDPEYRMARERMQSGIPIEDELVNELQDWSRHLDIEPPPFERPSHEHG